MSKKDPAFLFYPGDFLTGVSDLTFEERGQYITLLCLQHQKGRLTDKAVRLALGYAAAQTAGNAAGYAANNAETMPASDVLKKFDKDEDGLWFNKRLEEEIAKREQYSEKQRQRAAGRWSGSKTEVKNEPLTIKKKDPVGDAAAYAVAMPKIENENENEVKSEGMRREESEEGSEGKTRGAHTFQTSDVSTLETFKEAFKGTIYDLADLEYYFEAVSSWSASKKAKKADWIATARGFMLRDKKDGKLMTPQKRQSGSDTAWEYLRNGSPKTATA